MVQLEAGLRLLLCHLTVCWITLEARGRPGNSKKIIVNDDIKNVCEEKVMNGRNISTSRSRGNFERG